MKSSKGPRLLFAFVVGCLWVLYTVSCSRTSLGHNADEDRDQTLCEQSLEDYPTSYTYVAGRLSRPRRVEFEVRGDKAVIDGDIVLCSVEEAERVRLAVERAGSLEPQGIVITGSGKRWPNKKAIPYMIDDSLENPERVKDAIAHWEAKTEIRFVKLTNEKGYLKFVSNLSVCQSPVGYGEGARLVELKPTCAKGTVIHEIGHALGLWHEHAREDRDTYVEIIKTNIKPAKLSQFEQKISNGDDVGSYDYQSIMHYSRWAFQKEKGLETIKTIPTKVTIGQRDSLSAGDIATIKSIYP